MTFTRRPDGNLLNPMASLDFFSMDPRIPRGFEEIPTVQRSAVDVEKYPVASQIGPDLGFGAIPKMMKHLTGWW